MFQPKYNVAFINKKNVTDYSLDCLIDLKGNLWSVNTAPAFCCKVGVHTVQQAKLIKEKRDGIPVFIKKGDKTWRMCLEKLKMSEKASQPVLNSLHFYPVSHSLTERVKQLKNPDISNMLEPRVVYLQVGLTYVPD